MDLNAHILEECFNDYLRKFVICNQIPFFNFNHLQAMLIYRNQTFTLLLITFNEAFCIKEC